MADPFAQFGGSEIPDTQSGAPRTQTEVDPFAEFGGAVVAKGADPFAEFGGEQVVSSVDQEIQDRSFFDKPALGAEYTKKSEIEQIARKHGVDPGELESLAPYFGARMEGAGFASPEEFKRSAGGLGSIALNIPQKLYKKYRGGAMEGALDDLQNLASGRQSYTQLIGEIAVPGVGVGGRAATTAGKVAAGAATGATAGYASSSREQEVAGTLFGAGLGAAATALAAKLAKKAPEAERAVLEKVVQREGPNLDEGAEAILKARAGSEDDIQKIYQGTAELDQPMANRIVKEQLDPEFVTQVMDPGTEAGKLIRDAAARKGVDIETHLAQDVVESRVKGFAKELTGDTPKSLEEATKTITKYASRQGEEATAVKYKLFTEEGAALEHIQQQAIRIGKGDRFQDRALNMISDAQFVLRDIDEKAGTSLEAIHREMNSNANRMSFARNDTRKQLDEVFKANRSIDNVITDTDKLYNALDTGNISNLTPQEMKAAGQFRQIFDDGIEYANNLVRSKDPQISPMSIPKRENYVPHMMKQTEELLTEVNQRVTQLKQLASEVAGREITDLSQVSPAQYRKIVGSEPAQELIAALKTINNKQVTSAADLSATLKDTFSSRQGRIRLETVARAALERQGEIPLWMREKNLYKLADRWSTNTLKHLYLRKQMDAMRSVAKRLDATGAEVEASYVRNLLADINGIRKGTLAEATRQGEISYQGWVDKLADRATSPAGRGAAAVAKAIPTILNDINRQIYPNLLGLSPRAILMNATQTFAKTAPELGTKYGYTTILRGATHALLNRNSINQRVQKLGFVPAEFNAKYRQAVSDGIRRSSTYAVPQNVLNGMADAAMYFYTKMDSINRAITLGTADMMAGDLAKGSKIAREALNKFPSTVRKQVARAGSPQEIADIIGSHLNASTQYNYNRVSMSEYGRTMGPLFSTFSKWPTATAGEIIQEFREKGLLKGSLRNAEKFITPFLLFQAADYLIYGNDQEQMTDRQKKIMGVSGMTQSAPIGSAGAILKGDFFTPPAVDAIIQSLVVPTLEGDEGKLKRGLASAIQNFTPGAVYVRFLTDDLPTLITGERPEGSNFLERTQSGIEGITK